MSAQSNGTSFMISGRIVYTVGDLFKGQPETIFGTKTPKLNAQGKQNVKHGFGLAVSKSDQNAGKLMQVMQAEALQIYPSGVIPPSFAFKFKDGDGVDDKGIPFSKREGYAGHIVFNLSTNLPIKFFKYENGGNVQIAEGVKNGDYVTVQISVKAHGAIGQGKAGMYLNPMAVRLDGYGTEIVNTQFDADSVFGNAAPVVPQGASATPIGAPMNSFPMQQPQMPVQPNYGVLPQVHQPQYQQNPQGFPQQVPQQPMMPTQPQQPMMPQQPQGFGNPFGQHQ